MSEMAREIVRHGSPDEWQDTILEKSLAEGELVILLSKLASSHVPHSVPSRPRVIQHHLQSRMTGTATRALPCTRAEAGYTMRRLWNRKAKSDRSSGLNLAKKKAGRATDPAGAAQCGTAARQNERHRGAAPVARVGGAVRPNIPPHPGQRAQRLRRADKLTSPNRAA